MLLWCKIMKSATIDMLFKTYWAAAKPVLCASNNLIQTSLLSHSLARKLKFHL